MKWGQFVQVMLVIVSIALLAACTEDKPDQDPGGESDQQEVSDSGQDKLQQPETVEQEITLSAIGDMLIHDTVYEDARKRNGEFDFTPMLEEVKPILQDSTVAFANQETMIGGKELGLSSYPAFNSPYAVGDALKDAGIDVVSLANNHALDRGEEAITNAINHWENIDMMYTGAYKSEADRDQIRVHHTDEGITVAFLAYTYGTNGIPVPDGKEHLVNLIDREDMAERIQKANEQADAVVLSLHYGTEYERMPSEKQKSLVQFAADEGVDVVLGHHPHVLQPIDWIEGEDGHETLVAYSLGNFLSGQDEFYRRIGGIFQFTIQKTTKGEAEAIEIKSPEFMPTFVKYRNWANYEVTPMHQLTHDELTNSREHYEGIKEHMSQWVPELEFIEE